ncbi:MAG: sugar transferase [Pirellulales bacterium]|nr:sugar transferase [Pirellulales bacterium]
MKPSAYCQWKGTFDRAVAAVLLVPSLPIIAGLIVLVRLTSRGPAIYRQTRVGKDGKEFCMYKIRTMRHDAEMASGAVWTRPRDNRITLVGRALRKLHLDEFPQLFNVLRGEMSLVGPRPERPEFVHVLADVIPGYRRRLAVRPGITGLAQINLPPDTDLASVRRKVVLDVEYIETANLLLDLRMTLCTAARLLGLPGLHAMRLFRLERDVVVEAGGNGIALAPETLVRLERLGNVAAAELASALRRDAAAAATDGDGADRDHRANGNGKAGRHAADGRNGQAARELSLAKPR